MDKLETASNYSNFSECSTYTEYENSNLSVISGLTGFEEELGQLKCMINAESVQDLTVDQITCYEKTISKLKNDLLVSQNLNEKYKNDFNNLKGKIELASHDKFEKLFKYNKLLEAQLETANQQIKELLKNYQHKQNVNDNMSCMQLDKINFDSITQIQMFRKEMIHLQNQLEACENSKQLLYKELSDVKQDNQGKANCIVELKNKICLQHTNLHKAMQDNVHLSNQLSATQNELDRLNKSEKWYKQQLHMCQIEKQNVIKENFNTKIVLVEKGQEIESLKYELNKLNSEKTLVKKVCNIKVSPLKIEQEIDTKTTDENEQNNIEKIKEYYETTITSLANEIDNIKEIVKNQQFTFESLNHEKSDLLAKVTTLQKMLNEKEIYTESLKSDRNDLNQKLSFILDDQKETEKYLLEIRNEKSKLKIELQALTEEKNEVENTVAILHEDFNKFIMKYKNLQQEMQNKDRYIRQLQNEKHEIFMNNNWQICEIEHMKKQLHQNFDNKKVLTNQFALSETEILKIQLKELKDIISLLHKNIISFGQCELFGNTTDSIKMQLEQNTNEKIYENLKKHVVSSENLVYDMYLQFLNVEKSLDNHKNKSSELEQLKTNLLRENTLLQNKLVFTNNANENMITVEELLKILQYIYTNLNFYECNKNVENLDSTITLKINLDIKNTIQNINDLKIQYKKYTEEICNNYKKKFSDIYKYFLPKIQKLENKCKTLSQNSDESFKLLKYIANRNLSTNSLDSVGKMSHLEETEEFKRLRTIIKANDIEKKERHKRYEINNRTLLRKVKEHMRCRKQAEKHSAYLQEMYNNLSSELESIKFQLNSKEYELNNLHVIVERYEKNAEQFALKEKNISEALISFNNEKCLDLSSVNAEDYERNLKEKDVVINDCRVRIQELIHIVDILEKQKYESDIKIEDLQCTLSNITKKLDESERCLENVRKDLKDTQEQLLQKSDECAKNISCNNTLKSLLQDSSEKNNYLTNEIQNVSSTLHAKTEELSNLQVKYNEREDSWTEEKSKLQSLIASVKSELQLAEQDINILTNDKYFLQRICNDLKFALHSSVNQNKVFKEYIQNLVSKGREFSSLPDVMLNLPIPTKYDDTYINKLLERSSAPSQKLLSNVHDNLHLLKKELVILQKCITEKK